MSTSNLHIFSKDTDAPETQAGFEYQKLKTLETLLYNKVHGIKEVIYCDYEEDIFQRDLLKPMNKFRQIKLYSTNFSFATEEVHKALQHFFMLFVKSDYAHSEVEFVFEASSGIARKKMDNEAELLKDWQLHQGKLTGELLSRCRDTAKRIITPYIEQRASSLLATTEDDHLKKQIEEAKEIFDAFSEEDWNKFVNSVRWQFEDTSPMEALENCRDSISGLLEQIPFVVDSDQIRFAHGHLLRIISEKSIEKKPEDRKLDEDSLDHALLQLGDKKDTWYADVYLKWKEVKEINRFVISEFFEVIEASTYCRWNSLTHPHGNLWMQLLTSYCRMPGIPVSCNRKAIYEYIMLDFLIEPAPIHLMDEEVTWVTNYFEQTASSETARELEDSITLLQMARALLVNQDSRFSESQVERWHKQIKEIIEKKLNAAKSVDSQCAYLELMGHVSWPVTKKNSLEQAAKEAMEYYNKIVPLLPQTNMYNISDLSAKLSEQHKLLIQFSVPGQKEVIKAMKTFLEKIEPVVQERNGKHASAHKHVESGIVYLQNSDFESYLEALEHFHKAKLLWNQERTLEGVILAMINISQVYAGAKMHYAAKYYAMAALWDSSHLGTKNLNRISTCFALIMMSDFESGAWASALNDFEKYAASHATFDVDAWKHEQNEVSNHAVTFEGMLLYLVPLFSKELIPFIEEKKKHLGWLTTEILEPLIEGLREENIGKDVTKLIAAKLADQPLNDIGPARSMSWTTNGHNWKVECNNEWSVNAIAEELCFFMQVFQVELTRQGKDLHLINASIVIHVEKNAETDFKKPVKVPSNTEHHYRVKFPEIKVTDQAKISRHYAHVAASVIAIFQDLSVLPGNEFDEIIANMYKDGLAQKTLFVNAYQVMLREFFPEDDFAERTKLNPVADDNKIKPQVLNEILPLAQEDSPKYSKADSLNHIQNRYGAIHKTIHLSLDKWKKDDLFIDLIKRLRNEGWLDWQIVMALNNHALSHKANENIKFINFPSKEIARQFFEEEVNRIMRLPEENTYTEIPVSIFLGEDFNLLMKQIPIFTLGSFKLENMSKFPDHDAIRKLLVQRFHFSEDDVTTGNLLGDTS